MEASHEFWQGYQFYEVIFMTFLKSLDLKTHSKKPLSFSILHLNFTSDIKSNPTFTLVNDKSLLLIRVDQQ